MLVASDLTEAGLGVDWIADDMAFEFERDSSFSGSFEEAEVALSMRLPSPLA